jgi:hypothetical protein
MCEKSCKKEVVDVVAAAAVQVRSRVALKFPEWEIFR